MFERLRETIESILDTATPSAEGGAVLKKMHEAVVEAKVSLDKMREAVAKTEQLLTGERKQLDDAERRGRLAEGIDDDETQRIALEYAAKHREKVAILERKLTALRDELRLGEREFDEMREQLAEARKRPTGTLADDRIESAWRNIEAAGGVRPEADLNDEILKSKFDRATREAMAEEQLRRLKKKMGR